MRIQNLVYHCCDISIPCRQQGYNIFGIFVVTLFSSVGNEDTTFAVTLVVTFSFPIGKKKKYITFIVIYSHKITFQEGRRHIT